MGGDGGDEDEETRVKPAAAAPLDVTAKLASSATGKLVGNAESEDFRSGQFRTRFANSAVSLAEQFAFLVGGKPLRGAVQFRIELSTPDGPSTGGGAQALQHIKLVPADGGPTLVAGSIHLVEHTGELRTLDYLDAEHARRFSRSSLSPPPPPSARIDAARYQELLDRLREFCTDQDFKVTTADAARAARKVARAAPASVPAPVPAPVPGTPRWLLALVALVFLGTIAVVFFSMRAP